MKKMMSILLALVLLAAVWTASAEIADNTPSYLTPSVFVDYFNAMMAALADLYADTLGEEGVSVINEYYTITQKDEAMPIAYYGTKEWEIEAAFYYPDAENPTDTTPAHLMNLAIKTGTPEVAAYFARFTFARIIAYEYQDDAITQGLEEWIERVTDPADMFSLPGYTVNVFMTKDHTQYAVIPVDEQKEEKPDESALLTVTFDGHDYTLGKSTPADIAANGWKMNREEDGTFTLTDEYHDGMLLVRTENGGADEPITMFNAMWADEYLFEYCGFDGIINPGLAEGEDPDEKWNTDYPYEVKINAWEDPDIVIPPWGAMQNWLTAVCGATLSEEGIYEARVPLSDGRTLVIMTHDSPACLELVSE